MNFASIIMLLQMALGLLANPNVATNPALKMQALSFANQAIAIASASLTAQSNVPTNAPSSTLPTTQSSIVPSQPYIPPAASPVVSALSPIVIASSTPTVTSTQSVATTMSSSTSPMIVQLPPAITISSAPYGQGFTQSFALGSTGNTIGMFRFSETSDNPSVYVYLTDLVITDVTQASQPSFINPSIWLGTTPYPATVSTSPPASDNGYAYAFHFGARYTAPRIVGGNSIYLTLRADVASNAVVSSTHMFEIANAGDVTAHALAPNDTAITFMSPIVGGTTVTITSQ